MYYIFHGRVSLFQQDDCKPYYRYELRGVEGFYVLQAYDAHNYSHNLDGQFKASLSNFRCGECHKGD